MGVHICKRDGFIIQMGLSFKVWGILSCERIYVIRSLHLHHWPIDSQQKSNQ